MITRCLQRERHDRYPDWKAFVNVLSMAAARRGITVAPFIPKMRYQASARGAGVLRARVAGGAVVTGRGAEGRASVDVRGAARDLDEAKRLAGAGDWKAAVDLLSRVVLPSVVRELPDDPLQQTAVLTFARGLLELGRAAEAVTVARRPVRRDGKAGGAVHLPGAGASRSRSRAARRARGPGGPHRP